MAAVTRGSDGLRGSDSSSSGTDSSLSDSLQDTNKEAVHIKVKGNCKLSVSVCVLLIYSKKEFKRGAGLQQVRGLVGIF